jgi:hypothetical protein
MATKTAEEKAAEKAAKEQAKREELLKELAALNVTNTSGTETIAPLSGDETVEKLAELLKAAKAEAKAAEKAAGASTDPITVKYRDHKGEPTERTFSKEVHGEDFAKLADEFKATNAPRIIA